MGKFFDWKSPPSAKGPDKTVFTALCWKHGRVIYTSPHLYKAAGVLHEARKSLAQKTGSDVNEFEDWVYSLEYLFFPKESPPVSQSKTSG